MAVSRWRPGLIVLAYAILNLGKVDSSQEVIKMMTAKFSDVLNTCREEMSIPDHIMQDFYNFWREDYALVNRDLGCAIICMATKLDLITGDQKLHHENAHEFAKTHGADDDLAKQLVQIIHGCEKLPTTTTEECEMVLEIAKCFRTKIHGLKWAPSMEVVLEEVMTEI